MGSERKCQKCRTHIENNADLQASLIKDESQTFRDLQKIVEIKIFRCSLCFFLHGKRSNMKRHISQHYDRGEISYCAKCHKSISDISIEPLPDPQTEIGFCQPTNRSSFIRSTNQYDFDSLPVSKPWLPIECANCNKVYDYVGPLLCKLIASVYRDIRCKTETIRKRVVICRVCLEESEDKRYIVFHAFNHVKEGKVLCKPCQEVKGGSPIFEPRKEMLCQQCSKPIKDIKELQKRLITKYSYNTGMSVSIFNRAKKKEGTICYVCRLCLYRHRGQRAMSSHFNGHFKRNEVSFCTSCQKAMDELCISTLPDPANKMALLQTSSSSSVKKRSSVSATVPAPWKPVNCGKCGKVFDYLGSFLYKILDENIQGYFNSEGKVETREIYICRLCSTKGLKKQTMELHAMNHANRKDIMCKHCQEKQEPISSKEPYSEQEKLPKDLTFTDMDDLIRYNDHELEEILMTEVCAQPTA